jgi:hypothetical protein
MASKSVAAIYKDEIRRLQAEVAALKAQVTAKPLEGTTGIYVVKVPIDTEVETYKQMVALWREVWNARGVEYPPALIPLPTEVSIEQVTYNGFGMFVIRVPDDTPGELAARWAYAWDLAWLATETPNVPLMILSQSLDVQKFSDQQLRILGLMRIPDQRVGHA